MPVSEPSVDVTSTPVVLPSAPFDAASGPAAIDIAEATMHAAWDVATDDPERAVALADEAMRAVTDELRDRFVARKAIVLASTASTHSRYAEGLAHLDGLKLDDDDDERWKARALNAAGNSQHGLAQYGEALESFSAALNIYERLNIPSYIAIALANLSGTYHTLGDFHTALELLQRAHAIDEEIGNPRRLASTIGRIGWVYSDMGNPATALDYFVQALELAESVGDDRNVGIALDDIATTYAAMGDHEKALEHMERGLLKWRQRESLESMAVALTNLGTEYKAVGRFEAARAAYNEALALNERLGTKLNTAFVHVNFAILERLDGNLGKALDHALTSLAIADDVGARILIVACHEELANIYLGLDNYREAFEHQSKHYEFEQQVRSEDARRKLQQLESTRELELARKEAEIERLKNVELVEAHNALRIAHDNLKSAQTQLVHSEKMASLGQLTAGIAHEINNPVNFIRASAAPLRRDLDEVRNIVTRALQRLPMELRFAVEEEMRADEIDEIRTEIDSLLRGIEDGATRTAEIVKGLRAFSRLGEDQLKVVDLNEGIDSALVLLNSRLGNRIGVRREFAEATKVECYPGQINQVFMNILSNAIDAIEDQRSKGPRDQGSVGVITVRALC
ncbi:MAG: tetratricopeptide repeat protein, partial [bacterium]|nr:tetratricopeptide repeat protein [Candidatus Kapabacteria bacterium]